MEDNSGVELEVAGFQGGAGGSRGFRVILEWR